MADGRFPSELERSTEPYDPPYRVPPSTELATNPVYVVPSRPVPPAPDGEATYRQPPPPSPPLKERWSIPPPIIPVTTPALSPAFTRTRFSFMTGLPAGEMARVRDGDGEPVLSYRSFASVVGIVAALMAGVVFVTGLAAVIFLMSEGRPLTAILAVILSIAFSGVIAMLVPPINVVITTSDGASLTIAQTSRFSFPSATFTIKGDDQQELARVRRSVFSRIGRNRWALLHSSNLRILGRAIEESLGRALLRKAGGKFRRTLDANVIIESERGAAGTIVRRPDGDGNVDYLDLPAESPIDRRLAVALAILVLGSEP